MSTTPRYILNRWVYLVALDHNDHPALFSERYGRQRFHTVQVGRWCVHWRIGSERRWQP